MLNLSLGALAGIQLLAQFVLYLVVLRHVGAGVETDAYVAAQTLPLLLQTILVVSLQNVWQPRLAVVAADNKLWRDTQAIAQGQAVLVFLVVVPALCLSARWWVPLLFHGFTSTQLDLTVRMTQILLLASIFNGQAALFTIAQRARERFISAEAISIGGTLIAILAVLLIVGDHGIQSVAWITVVRSFLVCAIMFMMADCPRASIVQAWRSDMWSKLTPLLAGSSVYKTGPAVDRFWISQAPPGSVTVYNLVQLAMTAVATVIDRALTVSVAPMMARLAHTGDARGMQVLYRNCIQKATVVVAIAFCFLIATRPGWAYLASGVLRVSEPLADQMWLLCVLLLGQLHVMGCGSTVVAAFYAQGDTKTPVKVSVVSFLIAIALKSVAFATAGMAGLAIATSVYYLSNLLTMCILLERRIHAHISCRRRT